MYYYMSITSCEVLDQDQIHLWKTRVEKWRESSEFAYTMSGEEGVIRVYE